MSITVNMHKAKTDLSKLVAQALAGEEVIIARDGEPAVQLVPVRKKRVPGKFKGQIWMAPNFNDPLPDDLLSEFYDNPIFPQP